MMVLGVPGDVLTAILLGALMIQGLVPGPLLFAEHSDAVNAIFGSFFVAQAAMLLLGLVIVSDVACHYFGTDSGIEFQKDIVHFTQ